MLTGERAGLAAVIESAAREDLMALGYYTLEPVATKLGRSHPLLAAKLRIAMGLKFVEAKNRASTTMQRSGTSRRPATS